MSSASTVRTETAATLADKPFSSKAATLDYLGHRLTSARILPLFRLSLAVYLKQGNNAFATLFGEAWSHSPLAVRSSACGEDSHTSSEAGRYETVLNVEGPAALDLAVRTVFASYPDQNPAHEVLIQPMLREVVQSGVAFSIDPNTGSPYLVLNFSEDGDTQAITGGSSDKHRTIICSRRTPEVKDPLVAKLRTLLQELEDLTQTEALDVEFALDQTGQLYLLQVRPLIVRQASTVSVDEHETMLTTVSDCIRTRIQPHPYLFGRRTVFGVMPDWNPAEIIGTRPRPLALSLYRELVTDSVWAYQRHNYGYRNLRSFPLLCDYFGIPYIDVRVSFNSFLPSDLPESLAERLADHYIDELCRRPSLHDKVEFEIIYSCYTLDLPDRLRALSAAGFSQGDIACLEGSLRALTNRIINAQNGLWKKDLDKLDVLNKRFETIVARPDDPVAQIYWLLEDCKRYGTLPFAGLARAGFIAVQLLRSLVGVGALSEGDYQQFLGSLNTVSSEMGHDLHALDRSEFLRRYGHLRPGTYDIRSPRYDAAPDVYFNWSNISAEAEASVRRQFSLTLEQMNVIGALLDRHQLDHDVVGLFNFLKAGIEGRERAKFIFTRSLSCALERLADLGSGYGLSRDDMSYLNIDAIYALHGTCNDPGLVLKRSIEEGRRLYAQTCAINLPSLITGPDDAWLMESAACEPNYITLRSIQAQVVGVEDTRKLAGAIVVIPSADPGYDWLFSHNIGGLITAYGGVNSHMAIRAGELQIPAVIGVGETLFTKWSAARMLLIDCANKSVLVVS